MNVNVVIPVVPAASASGSSELAVSREVIIQELTITMMLQTKLLSTMMANESGLLIVSYNMCGFQLSRYVGCQRLS